MKAKIVPASKDEKKKKKNSDEGQRNLVKLKRYLNIGIVVLCVVTIITSVGLAAYLFVQFFVDETKANKKATDDVSKETKKAIHAHVSSVKRTSLSILAFYEGSSYVDYQEFNTFHSIINVDSTLVADMSWIVFVPESRMLNFHKTVKYLELPATRQEQINTTEFKKTITNHFLTSYVEPWDYSEFGKDLGGDDCADLLNRVMKREKSEYRVDYKNKYLELYIPVVKSALADTLVKKDNQNGVIRGRFKLNFMVEDGFSFHSEKCDYAVSFNGSLVHASCSSSDIKEREKDSYEVDLGYGFSMKISVIPKASLYTSSYRVLKWVFLFLPLILGVICCVFIFILGKRVIRYIVSQRQMKMMQKVAECISVMRFDDDIVQSLVHTKIKRGGNIHGTMKNIVLQMMEYRKYMPQTLLNQMKEKFLREGSSTSSANTQGSKGPKQGFTSEKQAAQAEADVLSSSSGSQADTHSSTTTDTSSKDSMASTTSTIDVSPVQVVNSDSYKHRHVVMMFVFIANMELKFRQFKRTRKLSMFKKVVQNALEKVYEHCCVSHSGDFHGFQGGVFQVSWNAVTAKVDRCLSAIRAAWDLVGESYFEDNDLRVCVGISSGEAMNATFSLHAHNIKQFDSIGYVVELSRRLMCANETYGTHILLDDFVASNCKYLVKARVVDYWLFKKYRKLKIYELTGVKDPSDDEWLYELEDGLDHEEGSEGKNAEAEAIETINTCWDDIVRGDFERAMRLCEEWTEKEGQCTNAFAEVKRVCVECIERQGKLQEGEKIVSYCKVIL